MYIDPMKISKELVAASTVPLVLSILAEGENYGYAIIQRVRDLSDGQMAWTDGMLYPVLHWLEENGHVKSTWKKTETGRRRKYYTLLQSGRKELERQRRQWSTVHQVLQSFWRAEPA